MDQVKIGGFLKELRKNKGLTQEQLAELMNVSGKTVSRWETGSNMPDISMLADIAEFYDVSIPEIICGERKNGNMDKETRETAVAMAQYSHNEVRKSRRSITGALMSAFGIFIIVSALAIFPSDSSWGSIYSVFGSIILVIGIYLIVRTLAAKHITRILVILVSAALLFGSFMLSDYIAVTQYEQVPRFRYKTIYDSRFPDRVVHETLFYTVVHENPGTADERVYIVK